MKTIIFLIFFCLSFTAKAVTICYGDNDMSAGTCFKGIQLNTNAMFNWTYVTGSGFWYNDARITTYVSGSSPAATWNFQTPVSGDVWFSVWIPSTNATAKYVSYYATCRGPYTGDVTVGKTINQLYYSAQWVTIANIGTFPAGTSCKVTATKLGGLISSETSSKMAIDGMKMSIY